ncbi:hypothetical protein JCM16814_23810 [Desulfobaculum senezii]
MEKAMNSRQEKRATFKLEPLEVHYETALKDIQAKCHECAGSCSEVKKCDSTDCPLHPYRLGKRVKLEDRGEGYLTPMEAIRAYCLECCGGYMKEVRLCPAKKCPARQYRFGMHPRVAHRKGYDVYQKETR